MYNDMFSLWLGAVVAREGVTSEPLCVGLLRRVPGWGRWEQLH